MERTLLRAGLSPHEINLLSLREAMQVFRAEQDREMLAWQRTAFVSAQIINWACFRQPLSNPVSPQDVLPFAFPGESARHVKMTRERLEANYEAHYERLERERRRKQDKGAAT